MFSARICSYSLVGVSVVHRLGMEVVGVVARVRLALGDEGMSCEVGQTNLAVGRRGMVG